MNGSGSTTTKAGPMTAQSGLSSARIRALIDEAITDSNDEFDEHAGLVGMIWEEVICPFPARIDGTEVECLGFQCPRNGYNMFAVCRCRKGKTHVVEIAKLDLVDPKPKGHEWLEAFFAWRSMQDD